MKNINILIADEQEMLRTGLRSVITKTPGFTCIGEAITSTQAIELVAKALPDIVILDTQLPPGDGVATCRTIRTKYPQVRVVMFTCYNNNEVLAASLLAGASGILLKNVSSSQLVQGMRTVAAGGVLVDDNLSKRLMQRLRGNNVDVYEQKNQLSEQQRNILVLIAKGKTNKEIAYFLGLSEKTVRNYVSNILAKLHMSNRAAAAAYAVREKLLH